MIGIRRNTFEGGVKAIESSDFQSFLKEQLLDPLIKQEYDALEEEYVMKQSGLSAKLLAVKSADR